MEAGTFGSKFQAMKNAVELTEPLRYKLRMFGVPIDGPTNIFCDNEAVYKNILLPESTFKKNHHSVAYHCSMQGGCCSGHRAGCERRHSNKPERPTIYENFPSREDEKSY